MYFNLEGEIQSQKRGRESKVRVVVLCQLLISVSRRACLVSVVKVAECVKNTIPSDGG